MTVALRLSAAVALALAAGGAVIAGGRIAHSTPIPPAAEPLKAAARAETLKVVVEPGGDLTALLGREGVVAIDAEAAAAALSERLDTVNLTSPLSLDLRVQRGVDRAEPARLLELAVHPTPERLVRLRRTSDGRFAVQDDDASRPSAPPPRSVVASGPSTQTRDVVVQGAMEQVLYGGAADAGATPGVVNRVIRVFAHRLDLARDLRLGDRVRLVIARPLDGQGRPSGDGELIYAELAGRGRTVRFYLHRDGEGAKPAFVDDGGEALSSELLRTPVDNPRVTSGFGMRLHPLLGYTRMHRGIDFGAAMGVPVVAAGDGVVEQVKWAGGYGRWIKLQHAGGWATGYGHLSNWAAGLKAGERVRQGQVIGYVGSSGLSTGPHLHYELYRDGEAIDPGGVRARLMPAVARQPWRLASEKRRVDAAFAAAGRIAALEPGAAGGGL